MSTQSIKKDTQRRNAFHITGGQIYTLNYFDTKPAVFQIRNFGNDLLYVSPSSSLSIAKYEIQINNGGTRIYSNPQGLNALMFFSPSDLDIIVNSWESDEFYPTDLDSTQATVIMNNTLAPNVGITSPLPAGTNNIGHVTLDNANISVTTQSQVEVTNDVGNPLPISSPITDLKPSNTPTILSVNCVTIGTEYSLILPAGTRKFSVSNADYDSTAYISIYYVSASGTVIKIRGDSSYNIEDIYLVGATTIYFKSTVANRIVQIDSWK